MDGSYLLQMNLRSGRESTSSGAAHEGQDDSGRAIEHDSGGGQEVPPLAPHPFLLPPTASVDDSRRDNGGVVGCSPGVSCCSPGNSS